VGSYFWIFGAFIGGAFGWCAGEFEQLKNGVAQSYRSYAAVAGWKPYKPYWRAKFAWTFGFLTLMASCALYGYVIFDVFPNVAIFCFAGAFLSAMILVVSFGVVYRRSGESKKKYKKRLRMRFVFGRDLIKRCNPIVLPLFLTAKVIEEAFFFVRLLLTNGARYTRATTSAIRFALREIIQFVSRILIYAHSEKRRIRFTGTFLGTVAGFFCGSAVIGGLFGGLFYIILFNFSVRHGWLKLVPAKAR
jgi:hypothetical protein